MKRTLVVSALFIALVGGCTSYRQSDQELWRDTPDYATTKRAVPPIRAYLYGEGTILEFPQGAAPAWIRIKDTAGHNVPFDQVGRYIRMPQRLPRFTAWINGVPREFLVAEGTSSSASVSSMAQPPTSVDLVPVKSTSPRPSERSAPVRLKRSTAARPAADLQADLDDVKVRIDQLTINKNGTQADWATVRQRLDAIEDRVGEAARSAIAIQFGYGSTNLSQVAR